MISIQMKHRLQEKLPSTPIQLTALHRLHYKNIFNHHPWIEYEVAAIRQHKANSVHYALFLKQKKKPSISPHILVISSCLTT